MDLEFNKNEDKMRLLISEMTQKFDKVSLGGGKSKIKNKHEQETGRTSTITNNSYVNIKDNNRIIATTLSFIINVYFYF